MGERAGAVPYRAGGYPLGSTPMTIMGVSRRRPFGAENFRKCRIYQSINQTLFKTFAPLGKWPATPADASAAERDWVRSS